MSGSSSVLRVSISIDKKSGHASVRATRSGAIDFLRVLGIIAVVIGHVWANKTVDMAIYTWHVPLFFFLSGYLWKEGRSLLMEIKKRSDALVKPYLFWLALVLIFSLFWEYATDGLTPGEIISPLYGGSFASRPFSAFWFVTTLFFASLLYRIMERKNLKLTIGIMALSLVAAATAGEYLARTPLAVGSALPCLFFIAGGALVRRGQHLIKMQSLVGLIVLMASAALVISGLSGPMDIKYGDYGTPVLSMFIACAIPAGILFVSQEVFKSLPHSISNCFTILASAGLVVVLAHAAFLQVLEAGSTGALPTFVIALVVPWGVGLILMRTRVAQWAAGVAPPSQK